MRDIKEENLNWTKMPFSINSPPTTDYSQKTTAPTYTMNITPKPTIHMKQLTSRQKATLTSVCSDSSTSLFIFQIHHWRGRMSDPTTWLPPSGAVSSCLK